MERLERGDEMAIIFGGLITAVSLIAMTEAKTSWEQWVYFFTALYGAYVVIRGEWR